MFWDEFHTEIFWLSAALATSSFVWCEASVFRAAF
jgi:hypothetical protein